MPDEFSYTIRIPKERVAVLIGTKGRVKRELEQRSHATIDVDSKEGEVTITGKDSITLFNLREVIQAIGRGFNPELARGLLSQDSLFEKVQISDFAKEKNHLIRIRGRIIGAAGKARRTIEELTGTSICVYGKTVGIIGRAEDVPHAKRAVELLLEGSTHASVYRWLEKQRRRQRLEELRNL